MKHITILLSVALLMLLSNCGSNWDLKRQVEETEEQLSQKEEGFTHRHQTPEGAELIFSYESGKGLQASYQTSTMPRPQAVSEYPVLHDAVGSSKRMSKLEQEEAYLLTTAGRWEVSEQGVLRYRGMKGEGGMMEDSSETHVEVRPLLASEPVHSETTSTPAAEDASATPSLRQRLSNWSLYCCPRRNSEATLPNTGNPTSSGSTDLLGENIDSLIEEPKMALDHPEIPGWLLSIDTAFDVAQILSMHVAEGIPNILLFRSGTLPFFNLVTGIFDLGIDLWTYGKYEWETCICNEKERVITSDLRKLYRCCFSAYKYGDQKNVKELAESLAATSSNSSPEDTSEKNSEEKLSKGLEELSDYYEIMNKINEQHEVLLFTDLEYKLKIGVLALGACTCVYTLGQSIFHLISHKDDEEDIVGMLRQMGEWTRDNIWHNTWHVLSSPSLSPYWIGINGIQTLVCSYHKIRNHSAKMQKVFNTVNKNLYDEAQRANPKPFYEKRIKINLALNPKADISSPKADMSDVEKDIARLKKIMQSNIVTSTDWKDKLGLDLDIPEPAVGQAFFEKVADLLQRDAEPFVVLDPGLSIKGLTDKLSAKNLKLPLGSQEEPTRIDFYQGEGIENASKKEDIKLKHAKFLEEDFAGEPGKPQWLLFSLKDEGLLPGTRVTKYANQEAYMKKNYEGYRVGTARECCMAIFGAALSGKKLLPKYIEGEATIEGKTSSYVRVANKWEKGSKGERIILGGFTDKGLSIGCSYKKEEEDKDKEFLDYVGLFAVYSTPAELLDKAEMQEMVSGKMSLEETRGKIVPYLGRDDEEKDNGGRFLSNFYNPTNKAGATTDYPTIYLVHDGERYPFYCMEVYYQCKKCIASPSANLRDIPEMIREFQECDAKGSKKLANEKYFQFDATKLSQIDEVMFEGLLQKFPNDPPNPLTKKLLATGEAILIEGNEWGDKNWGMVYGRDKGQFEGENKLGRMLMAIRSARREGKSDEGIDKSLWKKWSMDEMLRAGISGVDKLPNFLRDSA